MASSVEEETTRVLEDLGTMSELALLAATGETPDLGALLRTLAETDLALKRVAVFHARVLDQIRDRLGMNEGDPDA